MASKPGGSSGAQPDRNRNGWIVLAVAAAAFLGVLSSPPALLDDVDAAYARIARTMLESGDWVTARLNGVPYFDKPPGQVWAIAVSYAAFGVHDWTARLPMALAAMALCWLAWRTGRWAFGEPAGLYAGLGLATCYGLFLFTRVRMPDIFVACSTLFFLDCFLRAQEGGLRRARSRMSWAGAALGAGLLFKGLVAVALPLGAVGAYSVATGLWRNRQFWNRVGPLGTAAAAAAVAAPWHILAILRHPPFLDLALESGPGQYQGFFWRYFVNEHLLRFLGWRYPFDYDRVPLLWFWGGHLAWLFPWSGLLPGLRRLPFGAGDRAGRARLLMLCGCGFALVFFSLSTSQEYYTLPVYAPALLLLASAASRFPARLRGACRFAGTVHGAALAATATILAVAPPPPAGGDIAAALATNPDAYTLSLGHFQDLTLASFAYLREPLLLASAAFAAGAAGGWLLQGWRAPAALLCASLLLFQAAHRAMAVFDPYLSSRPLAAAYLAAPPGELVLDHEYYAFSSLAHYANRRTWLLNGRKNNIEYGSHAPGAPDVFLDDESFANLWAQDRATYLATYRQDRSRFEQLLGTDRLFTVAESGGKILLANREAPLTKTERGVGATGP